MAIDTTTVVKVEHSADGCAIVMICTEHIIIAVDQSGVVTLTRNELLSLAAAIPAQKPPKDYRPARPDHV